MKIHIIILTLLLFKSAFGQELPKKEGCIEIKIANHHFLYNKWHKPTKKISNKANRPSLLFYLDTLGNVIEKVGYGKQHNSDLRLLDFIEQNKYENGRLTNTVEYDTDYDCNVSASYKTIYLYNNANQLIQEKQFYYDTDSLFIKFDYEYDTNGNKTKTLFNPTYYYQRIFDEQSKIQSLKQIYESKLRWEWNYIYTDTSRIGEFRTFYKDGNNYTKKENRIYRNGKLLEVEEKYISQEGLSSKTIFHYDLIGLIIKTEYFEAYSNNVEYQLKGFTEIKTRSCCKLTHEMIEKINYIIYDE